MMRLNFVLMLAVLATMMFTVKVQYESRQLFVAIEKATVDVRKLELEHTALQVESRAQATPLIIEKIAKEKLNMRSATPAVTQYTSKPSVGKEGVTSTSNLKSESVK